MVGVREQDSIVQTESKMNLVGLTPEEILEIITQMGEPAFRARQVCSGIYNRRVLSWDHFTDLAKSLRERLRTKYEIQYPIAKQIYQSEDGTRRYLFGVGPQQWIESVFIPEESRDTFCISTQVGCAVGCLYCLTGKLPMRRNLTVGEIIGQVLALLADRDTSSKRLNIVIMGMGEPLFNYDNVMKSIRLMTDERALALSPRRITLSTSGVVPGILKLASEPVIPNLAISLNATTNKVRDQLIPINRKWKIAELLDACRSFSLDKRQRITFEYVLISGINDAPEDARRLVKLLAGLKQKVNLIPLNEDPRIPLKSPSGEQILKFQKILIDKHITASIRRPRGADISAACGLLAGLEIKNPLQ
jgi:23S rRNA (adenine2503-C2)-methyltransferase